MYFWNLSKLKSQMAERPLTDREVLPYLVVCNAIIAAVYSLALLPFNRWDALGVIWSVALAIGGTLYVYRCKWRRSWRAFFAMLVGDWLGRGDSLRGRIDRCVNSALRRYRGFRRNLRRNNVVRVSGVRSLGAYRL